ncbi:hypothetical protein [Butyricimonas synergistica]|uniref:hypothetical protein n=1 Tax=Butyricimonas synergistica TaxID=544644 RepID=UPI000363D28F|nr:hypothetical protein [Butyricimonas synergistica]
MKQLILFITLVWTVIGVGCHEKTIGFLVTENASYNPDSLYVRKTPDPKLDAIRMETKAPWISTKLQGYEGTEQIYFSVESVTSDQGEEAARVFMKNLAIRGGGALMYPFENDAIPGRYKVSVRLTNPGYTQVIENAFTFIVVE